MPQTFVTDWSRRETHLRNWITRMSIRACEEASMILPLGEYEEEAEYKAESLQGPEDHEPHNCAKGTKKGGTLTDYSTRVVL